MNHNYLILEISLQKTTKLIQQVERKQRERRYKYYCDFLFLSVGVTTAKYFSGLKNYLRQLPKCCAMLLAGSSLYLAGTA